MNTQKLITFRRSGMCLVILALIFLLSGGPAAVLAGGMSWVTGGIGLEPPNWGDYFRVWIEFDVHQVNLSTFDADGMIRARVYNPTLGWKHLWYKAECVSFAEVDGKQSATVVASIERREGWDDVPGAGDPGEYLRWKLVDGGTPGSDGDVWYLEYYDYDNYVEYWPTFPDGGCANFNGEETNYIDYGNLSIH